MAKPTTRQEFKDFILRKLGHPMLKINVTEDQLEDRVDDALQLYRDYHYDGQYRLYYKHVVTSTDKQNEYIELPEYIQGVTNIFDMGLVMTSTNNIFSLKYQLVQHDVHSLLSQSMVPYYATFQHLSLIDELLVGKKPIRYNRHINKLHIDMDWNTIQEGQIIMVDCYAYTDPAEFPNVWSDLWLQKYTAALVKQQWGSNMSKFQGIQMAGGVTFSGAEIESKAEQELIALREELDRNSPILIDFMG